MMEFHYEAYTREGGRVKGKEVAESRLALENLLISRGLLPKNITRRPSINFRLTPSAKVKSHEFLMFVGELISLLQSGMGIPQAVAILADTDEGTVFSSELNQIHKRIKSGASFSAACSGSPHLFDALFISALKTGEQAGDLVRPLNAYYKYLERRIGLKSKVTQALTYPIFLLITFAIILGLMFAFVVPNFTNLYNDLSAEMPVLTVWLLKFVEHLHIVLVAILVIVLLMILALRHIKSNKNGRIWLDMMKARIPFFGPSYLLHTYWQFTQSLASLLRGGGNLLFALKTSRDISTNTYFSTRLDSVVHRVANGESLAQALGTETAMPKRSLKIISVGEESSNLETMLETVSNYFEFQLDDKVKRLISLIEPMIMLAIGLVVGVVIVALYLPVFGMVNVLG